MLAQPDRRAFLSQLDQIHLVAIHPENHPPEGHDFGLDVDRAVKWADECNSRGFGVYWTANRVRPGVDKKPSKVDIIAPRFAHVDIDPPKDGSPWDPEVAKQRLLNAPLPPSIIIWSGNGWQALWAVEDAAKDEVERVNRGLIAYFGGDAGTHNIDRLLRVPGTRNFPTPKKRKLGRAVALARLEQPHTGEVFTTAQLLDAYSGDNRETVVADPSLPKSDFSAIEYLSADDLELDSKAYLRRLIEQPKGDDRSDDIVHCACEMFRQGHTVRQIAGVLLNPANAISAHCHDQRDPLRAAMRAIKYAREAVTAEETAPGQEPRPIPDHDRLNTPNPLPAPYPGFMATTVGLALTTAHIPQPEITLLAVLVGMAAACSGNVCLPDGMRLNLYGLGVAPTSSGKHHPISVSCAIANAAGAKLLGDLASGAGVEDALTGERSMLTVIDEIAHTLAARNDKDNSHLKGVEQKLLRLFSASDSTYTTRALAGNPGKTIENPCLSLLGFAVPTKLGEALSVGDAVSGLLNRLLIAVGDGNADPRIGVRSKFQLTPEMKSQLDAVRMAGLQSAVITIPEEVQAYIDCLMLDLHAQMKKYPEESAERCLFGRTLEKAKRIAGVIAFFENPSCPVLKMEHIEWAVAFAQASDAMLLHFIRKHMHGGKVQAYAARIKGIMADILQGKVTGTRPGEIAAIAKRYCPISIVLKRSRLSKRDLDDAVDHLVACGDIVREQFKHAPSGGAKVNIGVIYFPSER